MTRSIKFSIVLGLVVLFAMAYVAIAYASATFNVPTQPVDTYKNFTFFSATTTTATSTNTADGGGYLVINGAKKVMVYFTHGGTATTSTTGALFTIQTSRDGVNWDNFGTLNGADVSQTATTSYTIQGATSTVPVALDILKKDFYAIRCISTEIASPAGTDGEQTCSASVQF